MECQYLDSFALFPAYCRNTEFEESSSETDCYIDEYEIASFDEQEQKQSDEGDSDIEVRNSPTFPTNNSSS